MEPMRVRRKAFLESIPWVTWKPEGKQCQGIRWNRMARTAGPHNLDEYRCKTVGHWHFTALRQRGKYRGESKTGTYCQQHLWNHLEGTPQEQARLNRYREEWRKR